MTKTKTLISYRYIYAAAALTLLACILFSIVKTLPAAAAATAQLYLTPASQSVQAGSNLTFNLVLDTKGNTVNGVQMTVNFPTAEFSYVNAVPDPSTNSPTFTLTTPLTSQNSAKFQPGQVGIGAYTFSGVKGIFTVAAVTLRANSAGSNLGITLSGICVGTGGANSSTCSAVTDATTQNTNDLGGIAGASYTVVASNSGGSGGGSTGGSSGGASGGSVSASKVPGPAKASSGSAATGTAAAASAAPKISGVSVTNISDSQATISWQTDVPATTLVNYGLSKSFGLSAQAAGLTTNHSVTLVAPNVIKGASYYFQVASASAGGASATGGIMRFNTPGFDVTLLVVDKNHKPLKNVTVKLANNTAKTDSQGRAVFKDVSAGRHKVVIKAGGKTTETTIQVGKFDPSTKAYAKQQFTLTGATSSVTWAYIAGAALVIIIVLIIVRPFGTGLGGPLSSMKPPKLNSAGPGAPAGMETPTVMRPSDDPQTPAPITPQSSPQQPQHSHAVENLHPHNDEQHPGAIYSPQNH